MMVNLINWKKTLPIFSHTQRNPFIALQQELDKAMGDFYRWVDDTPQTLASQFDDVLISPALDVVEDKDHIKIEVELPGMGEEDVKLSIADNVLTIKGEKTISKKDEGKNYISREINYGSYERHITLPETVDPDQATATFKKGMLWVNIPKKAGAMKQTRDIPVKKASN